MAPRLGIGRVPGRVKVALGLGRAHAEQYPQICKKEHDVSRVIATIRLFFKVTENSVRLRLGLCRR